MTNVCFLFKMMPYVMNLSSPCSCTNPCSNQILFSTVVFKKTVSSLWAETCPVFYLSFHPQCLPSSVWYSVDLIIYWMSIHLNLDLRIYVLTLKSVFFFFLFMSMPFCFTRRCLVFLPRLFTGPPWNKLFTSQGSPGILSNHSQYLLLLW